jgi:hypothetical protein
MNKIKIYKAKDKIKGVCSKCDKVVTGTLRNEDYQYKNVKIPGILQLFCDKCGNYIGKPYQSSVRIHKYVVDNKEKDVSVRVPGHLVDILYLIGKKLKLAPEPNGVWKAISKLYVVQMKDTRIKDISRHYQAWLKDDLSSGKASFKLSCRMDINTYNTFNNWSKQIHMTKSNLMRGVIVGAKYDILDEDKSHALKDFEKVVHLIC